MKSRYYLDTGIGNAYGGVVFHYDKELKSWLMVVGCCVGDGGEVSVSRSAVRGVMNGVLQKNKVSIYCYIRDIQGSSYSLDFDKLGKSLLQVYETTAYETLDGLTRGVESEVGEDGSFKVEVYDTDSFDEISVHTFPIDCVEDIMSFIYEYEHLEEKENEHTT